MMDQATDPEVGIEDSAFGCSNAGRDGLPDYPKALFSGLSDDRRSARAHDMDDVQWHVGKLCQLYCPECRLILRCLSPQTVAYLPLEPKAIHRSCGRGRMSEWKKADGAVWRIDWCRDACAVLRTGKAVCLASLPR